MVKKKGKSSKGGKKKKKSAKKSAAEDKVEGLENADPNTLISGDDPAEGGKKKKKKKKGKVKKLSKSEKSLEKLEKSVEKMKAKEDVYDTFITKLHQWLVTFSANAMDMFKRIDTDGEGILSFDEFKAGLFDLGAPVNKVEAHLLCKLLDEDDSGEIDYTDLEKGLQYAKEVRELEKLRLRDERQLIPTERKFPTYPGSKMIRVEPWKEPLPRYILLELRSVTFDRLQDYPGHLELLVQSHLPVVAIIQLIIQHTDISSTTLSVFTDASRSPESVLPPSLTLEEAGFPGESREAPEEVTLYYDYTVEFKDSPILMCDHYFGQKLG